MRKLWSLLYLIFAVSHLVQVHGQSSAPLTRVSQVNELTNAQAAQSLPVKLEGIVTFVHPEDGSLFVESDGHGTYVNFSRDLNLLPGDRVLVSGITGASFRPEVTASDVRFLGRGSLPVPPPAKYEDLIRSRFDSRYVVVTGHVLAAATRNPGIRIQLAVPNGLVEAYVAHPAALRTEDLLDANIRLTGVAGGEFDSRMQMAGVWLDVNSATDIVIEHPPSNPWNQPAVPLDQVIFSYRRSNDSSRVRIVGTLTYYEPGELAVVEQGGQAILVETDTELPLHAGEEVEVTGFPEIVAENVRLDRGQVRSLGRKGTAQPLKVDWENASTGKSAYELVEMDGVVVGLVHDSRVDLFIILSGGHLFSATMRHSSSDASDPGAASKAPAVGSRVRVTGVCFVDAGNHWRDRLWFDLRMRSLRDVTVVQQPSWWTVKRMAYVVTAMSVVILAAVIWLGMLDRRLRKQNAIMARQSQEEAMRERHLARQEQQRSHILELISSPAPLSDVLREIQVMVSSRLLGGSCWFELHAAAEGGSNADRPAGPAIVFQELFSRDGNSLGFLLATPRLSSTADSDVSAALLAGARLAELAIDTRRLYSDLHRRSEYDLLTDIPNRFSMERKLDQLMLSARSSDSVFGLVYVDLDHFKQVNDRYGHHIGDLYLQEATRRMKLQLRTGDVLARIGGDEFIALVPILRSRVDAEEIATRIEHCFDEPFELEGDRLTGSASIGLAVYPEDGATKEELQRSADAAMYAHKQSKREREKRAEADYLLERGTIRG